MGLPPGFRLPSLVELDREHARRGLYHFVKRTWPHVVPGKFRDGWHIEAICSVLEDVSYGRRKRVVINVPPGTGKSLLTGVFWPAWDAIEVNPQRQWMYASFDSSLLNGQSTRLINLWQSPWFIERWGRFLPLGRPNTSEIKTLQGGMKFNTSFGGRGTGRHCDIQPIDDPIKPRDAAGGAAVSGVILEATWRTMADTFASRARDPATFARVLIMQRIHEDDPSARALAEGWEHVCFPMRYESDGVGALLVDKDGRPLDRRTVDGETLNAERFTPEWCDQQEHDVGPDVWATQYQQRPAAPGGAIIREEWIDPYSCTLEEARAKNGQKIQSWDLTFKDAESSDFVAGGHWTVTWDTDASGNTVPHFWLTDVVNERLSFVATCNTILGKRTAWPSSEILIEDKANGPACENVLRNAMLGLITLVNPQGSKLSRIHACAPLFANGQVHIPRDAEWSTSYRSTLLRFPRVRRDDVVDMTSQALLKLGQSSLFHAAMGAIGRASN